MKKFKYTKEHLDFLRTEYLSMNTYDLTRAFNKCFKLRKTETAIKSALKNHKILCGRAHKDRLINRFRVFTSEMVRFVRENYKHASIPDLTTLFNDKFNTDMTQMQIRCLTRNRKITSGRTGRFEKGHVNWNAGTKGQGLTSANKTSFKKGNVPANHRPVGSERIDSRDGYVLIKIEETDPNFGWPTRWKQKHVHVWEQENGPVPDGFVLRFKDGGKLNINPENLILIPMALNLRLNKYCYNEAPDELKQSILALAKLEIKTFSIEKDQFNQYNQSTI